MIEEFIELLQQCHNSENTAINAKELAIIFNTSTRGVRMIVTQLRVDGYPICSGNSGYWYASDYADVQRTAARLQAQVNNMQKAITGLLKGKAMECIKSEI